MKNTALIVGASVGYGHMRAAVNVAKALTATREDLSVKVINIFDYLPWHLRLLCEDGWRIASCHSKRVYGNLYRRSMSRRSSRLIAGWLIRSAAERLVEEIEHSNVSLYVATQGMAASVGSLLKERYKFRFCVVATDFVLHSLQVFPNVDYYYLPPNCQMSISTSAAGELFGKSRVTGIPIAAEFGAKRDKETLRGHFGLSQNLTTVLFSFGGGLRAEKHIQLFADLLSFRLPLQFLVLTGQNTQFAAEMRRRYGGSEYENRIKIFDYLDDVSSFYAVADLFIGKAGGLTISEALATGLPIGIVDMLPGQEGFNIKTLSSQGLCCFTRNTAELSQWIEAMLSGGISLSWKEKVDSFARPLSSITIADHLAASLT